MNKNHKAIYPNEVLEIFQVSQALLEGHFLLTSGRHSGKYMQCAKVLQYPHHATRLGEALAEKFTDQEIELVVGPAVGGIIVAHEVARALGVKSVFTEREKGEMKLRRGFELKPGQKVLVAEDVITTGGSVREVMEVVKAHGAEVVGVGALVDRSGGKVDFGVPFVALLKVEVENYLPEECPYCQQGIPAVKPGSREKEA